MPNNFVGTSNFTLPDNILQKFRRDKFLRGGVGPGPESTQGAIAGAFESGRKLASEQSRFAASLESADRSRATQERIAALDREERKSTEKRNRKTALFAGLAKVGTQALFMPFGAKTSGSGVTTYSTGAGAIFNGIAKLFP